MWVGSCEVNSLVLMHMYARVLFQEIKSEAMSELCRSVGRLCRMHVCVCVCSHRPFLVDLIFFSSF